MKRSVSWTCSTLSARATSSAWRVARRYGRSTYAAGGSVWACSGCHRPPHLTAEAWHAQQAAERHAVEQHLASAAAAAPAPRTALLEVLARLEAARKTLAAAEAALPVSRVAYLFQIDSEPMAVRREPLLRALGIATVTLHGKPEFC